MDLLIETIILCENKNPGKILLLLVTRLEPDIKKRMSLVLVEDMELNYDGLKMDRTDGKYSPIRCSAERFEGVY